MTITILLLFSNTGQNKVGHQDPPEHTAPPGGHRPLPGQGPDTSLRDLPPGVSVMGQEGGKDKQEKDL